LGYWEVFSRGLKFNALKIYPKVKATNSNGFTLLELLIVLAVMGLMMGLIGFSLLGGGGAELGAAQRELLGYVQQARSRAALSGSETRLIVNDMEGDIDKYHRYMEIIVQDTCSTTGEVKWLVMGEGKYLTDGVYFVPEEKGKSEVGTDWRSDAFTVWSEAGETFSLADSFKGERKLNGESKFRYLAFNQMGNVVFPESSGGGMQKAPRLVLGVGAPNPTGEGKPLRFDNPNSIAGILLRRYGGFAVLELEDFE
jgi:prepilin-type N-terminal cleavage/methylation domain-containing protein